MRYRVDLMVPATPAADWCNLTTDRKGGNESYSSGGTARDDQSPPELGSGDESGCSTPQTFPSALGANNADDRGRACSP